MEELQQEIRKAKITFSLLAGALLLLSMLTVAVSLSSETVEGTRATASMEAVPERVEGSSLSGNGAAPEAVRENPFDSVEIDAVSAVVWDLKSDSALYRKNSTLSLPIASFTKIMTATVALEEASPDTLVTVDRESFMQYGNSGLYVNEVWRLEDLIEIIMVTSANDAAFAIASTVGSLSVEGLSSEARREHFIAQMNQKANKLGLFSTRFINPTGLDEDEENGGAYSTADDIVQLLRYAVRNHTSALYPTRNSHIYKTSESSLSHEFENTNPFVSQVDGIVASKTGYTDLAGGNLAVVFNADLGHPVAVVVMGSTFEGRFSDTEVLIEAAREYTRYDR